MPKKKTDLSGSFEIRPQLEHSIKLKQRKFKFTSKQHMFLEMVLDPKTQLFLYRDQREVLKHICHYMRPFK